MIDIGLISVAALLAAADPSAAASVTARSDDDNQMVCKSQARTGTRFKTRTCKTRFQWEQLRLQQQRDVKEMIDRPVIETRRGG